MNVLVVGGGGREHALAWKIAQSPIVKKIYVAPGNGGTASTGTNLPIKSNDISGLLNAAKELQVDLTVVGPENPLSEGIVDLFQREGLAIFGPSRAAARLESSKVFAKSVMENHDIPCAQGKVFDSFRDAEDYINKSPPFPLAVKADGLAAGKGVVVAASPDEAITALKNMMVTRAFGNAGDRVIIEEGLTGKEVSLIAFTDGKNVAVMPPACDYKRIYDGDKGPNTGGMGGYSPPPFFNADLKEYVIQKIIKPTISAMADTGIPYKGVLYAGLMLTGEGPKVLEFNARFGDPETQVILPLLKTDLLDIFRAVNKGELDKIRVDWADTSCVGVVLASEGYPGEFNTGYTIHGLDQLDKDVLAFHAGTKLDNDTLVTDGGRVMTISSTGDNLEGARKKSYMNVSRINFQGCYYRRDIASFA